VAKIADVSGDGAARDAALAHAAKLPGGAEAVDAGRADLMLIHRDFAGAENLTRAIVARDPRNANAWTLLGSALAQQGKAQEALVAFQKALDLRPTANLVRAVATMRNQVKREQASNAAGTPVPP